MATIEQLESALVKADAAGNAEDARALAVALRQMRGSPTAVPEPPAKAQPSMLTRAASGLSAIAQHPGFAMGLGDVPAKIEQVGTAIIPKFLGGDDDPTMDAKKREAEYQAARAARGESGFDAPRMVGNLAQPLNWLPGMALGGKVPTTIGQAVTQGAKIGAPVAMMQPVIGDEDVLTGTMKQGAMGTVAGGLTGGMTYGAGKAIAAAPDAWQRTRAVIPNWLWPRFLGGSNPQTAGRYIAEQDMLARIDPTRRQAVAEAVQKYAKEIVPGSKPTTAQAAAAVRESSGLPMPERALLQSHQEKLQSHPSVNPQFVQRADEQLAAQQSALREIAKGTTVGKSVAARKVATDPLYEAAKQEVVKVDADLKGILSSDAMKEAMNETSKLMSNKQIFLPKEKRYISIGELENARKYIGDSIPKPSDAGYNKTKAEAIGELRDKLTQWINKHSKAMETARGTFATMSGPVNRAQVRGALMERLVDPTTKATPGTFLRAADDVTKTMKAATGNPRYQRLGQVLTPQETAAARRVTADVERGMRAKLPSVRADVETPAGVARSATPDIPDWLQRGMTFAQWALRARGQQLTPEIAKRSAQLQLDPSQFVDLMRANAPSQREAIIEALLQRQLPMAAAVGYERGGRE